MAISKMPRDAEIHHDPAEMDDDTFDFGEPEVIPVEISPGRFLCLKEPSASDLIEISKISDEKNVSDVEATLRTICILHSPDAGKRRLSMKDAKRLRAKQLKMLGNAINQLLGMDGREEEE